MNLLKKFAGAGMGGMGGGMPGGMGGFPGFGFPPGAGDQPQPPRADPKPKPEFDDGLD